MRVLINAFACSPYRGSECAVGWNIPKELARLHDVTVVCGDLKAERPNWRDLADYGLDKIPFTVAYVAPSRLMTWLERAHRLPGLWFLYYAAYNLWQRKALRRARALQKGRPFDVVHQLNMIGYREPGYLWTLGIPFVWGPIGGAPNEPWAYRSLFSLAGRFKVGMRTVMNEIQKRVCWRARLAARRARKLWVVTAADERMVAEIWHRPCVRCLETGVEWQNGACVRKWTANETLRLVWSGIHTSRKALPILLHALANVNRTLDFRLEILGEGPETETWKCLAVQLGLSDKLTWHGRITHDAALQRMNKAHMLMFTSIKEGTPHVVAEAISLGLPVICHDACGMGTLVTESCGVKIPLKDSATSIVGFANALTQIEQHPEWVERMSCGAIERAKELTWSKKAQEVSQGYVEALAEVGRIYM